MDALESLFHLKVDQIIEEEREKALKSFKKVRLRMLMSFDAKVVKQFYRLISGIDETNHVQYASLFMDKMMTMSIAIRDTLLHEIFPFIRLVHSALEHNEPIEVDSEEEEDGVIYRFNGLPHVIKWYRDTDDYSFLYEEMDDSFYFPPLIRNHAYTKEQCLNFVKEVSKNG